MTTEEMQYHLKNLFISLVCVGITLLVPAALLLNGIAGTIRPTTLHEIYHTLPEDAHGFSQTERLDLALLTLTYLHHPEPAATAVRFLESQRLPGTNQPLYNERELAHLVDVKRVVATLDLWAARLGLLFSLSLMALIWPKTRSYVFWALWRGLKVSGLLLVAAVLLFMFFWPYFFTTFHHLLFPPGSWYFPTTDSLIRLFPEAFWLDYAWSVVLWQMMSIGLLLLLMSVVALFTLELTPDLDFERELARFFWEDVKATGARLLGLKTPQPEPRALEQFIFYSDLAATQRPSECDEDDEEDNLPW